MERQPTPLGGMETLVPRVQLLSHAADRRIAGGIADEGSECNSPRNVTSQSPLAWTQTFPPAMAKLRRRMHIA